MGDLIDGLLALFKVTRTEIHRTKVDLSALALVVADQLKASGGERQVSFSFEENVVVLGDPRLLRALLENLLGNAWKFTANRPSARVEFGVKQRDSEPEYFIRDDGAGFDMTYADKLFHPFQRLHHDDEFEGTGIGLATVKRIVQRHGGRVRAEGEVGRGATVFFTLSSARVGAPDLTLEH